MKRNPKVSIICWTYNQKEYIAHTLDGFIAQKTDFPFEVVVHDDASTDGTTAIIREYERKNPTIIKPIYQKKNRFSNGTGDFINQTFEAAKGKYIALCEGDDYWTDPNKLQKQTDFLEMNSDYALCFHPVKVVFEGGNDKDYTFPASGNTDDFTVERLLQENYIQTNSVMYRRRSKRAILPEYIMPRDWYLHLYHAQFGKIGFINDVMAVYRRHSGGIWWDSDKNWEGFWKKNGPNHIKLFRELLKMYGETPKYRMIITGSAVRMTLDLIKVSENKVADIPGVSVESAELISSMFEELNRASQDLQKEIEGLRRELIKDKQTTQKQLDAIYGSKSWKITKPLRNISSIVAKTKRR